MVVERRQDCQIVRMWKQWECHFQSYLHSPHPTYHTIWWWKTRLWGNKRVRIRGCGNVSVPSPKLPQIPGYNTLIVLYSHSLILSLSYTLSYTPLLFARFPKLKIYIHIWKHSPQLPYSQQPSYETSLILPYLDFPDNNDVMWENSEKPLRTFIFTSKTIAFLEF